jgi:cytochrome c-type biogenesis protein CcmF
MNLGDLLLRLAFLLTLPAGFLFLQDLRGRRSQAMADWLFGLHAAALLGAMALLWSYFLGHRFEFQYVAQYSSRALSPAMAFAASWAGQEGSILLWAALGALVGLALMREPGPLPRPAMFFVTLMQLALVALLLLRSPFRVSAVVPPDGQGLNPLLEDPWMVVHPPVLFAGYAVMTAPFALAAAALVLGHLREWNRAVWPWALLAVVTLGTGIALGGVWAYRVLGWGGYWGWDPVENASLVPWLVGVALLHGILIQRTTRALARTNLLLALLGWLMVLGGTYLTRSGVLQDFSVHSFADSGLNTPLLLILGGTFVISAGLLTWRSLLWLRQPSPETRSTGWGNLSRESALWLGLVTVLLFAVMVTFGTTIPLLTSLAGRPASIHASFYESMSVPLGILLVLVMAIAPALRWSRQVGLGWLIALMPGFVGGMLALAAALFLGAKDASQLALLATAGLALGINLWMMVRLFRRGWTYGAGYLGHAGLAVMVLGMVMSTALGKTERLTLRPGVPSEALGYTLTYEGDEPDSRGGHRLKVHVAAPGWSFEARPQLLQMASGEGTMRKPAISGRRELYLSPLEVRQGTPGLEQLVWLPLGQAVTAGDASWTFVGFRMESHDAMQVFADIDLRRGERTVRISPGLRADARGTHPLPLRIPGLGDISVGRIDADHKRVGMLLPGAALSSLVVVEFSTKPLVNLVWVGALLALLGTILAGFRRAAQVAPGPVARPNPSLTVEERAGGTTS